MLEPLVEETPRLIQISCQHHGPEMANRSSEEIVREGDERNGEEEHSPSPFLPKRKAVISLAVMDETEPDKEGMDDEMAEKEKKDEEGGAVEEVNEEEDDIGSPFQWMDTVYV